MWTNKFGLYFLEKKLDRVYEKNGRTNKRAILTQLRHRSDNFLQNNPSNGLVTIADTSECSGGTINSSIINKKLFPEQAISLEEKLKLVKHDQLQMNSQDEDHLSQEREAGLNIKHDSLPSTASSS